MPAKGKDLCQIEGYGGGEGRASVSTFRSAEGSKKSDKVVRPSLGNDPGEKKKRRRKRRGIKRSDREKNKGLCGSWQNIEKTEGSSKNVGVERNVQKEGKRNGE